jgi:hypothetical protein
MFKRISIFFMCFCGACAAQRPIDISDPSKQPAVLCDMHSEAAYADHTQRRVNRQILVYPNTDLRALKIAFTGQFQMKPICESDQVCNVERSGSIIRITTKPGEQHITAAPNELGYKEIYEFDQAKKTIVYQSGGGLGPDVLAGEPLVGTCKRSPRVIE